MAVHIFGNDVLEEIKTYRQRRGKRLRDSSNRDDDTRRHAHLVDFTIDDDDVPTTAQLGVCFSGHFFPRRL